MKLFTVERLGWRGGRTIVLDRMRVLADTRELAAKSAREKWGEGATVSVTTARAG